MRKLNILTELMKLRRACCAPALADLGVKLPGAKLGAFMDLAAELVRGGHKALVFSQLWVALPRRDAALRPAASPASTSTARRPNASGSPASRPFRPGRAISSSSASRRAGRGSTTAADYVIHLDPWWNPAVEDQASDRAYRLGQERPVTVYRLVARDTVEEAILRLHRSQQARPCRRHPRRGRSPQRSRTARTPPHGRPRVLKKAGQNKGA
ncbi:MAG: C-terminal helicase domain-containing protein [Bilophila sp.]